MILLLLLILKLSARALAKMGCPDTFGNGVIIDAALKGNRQWCSTETYLSNISLYNLGDINLIDCLLSKGGKLNFQGKNGNSALVEKSFRTISCPTCCSHYSDRCGRRWGGIQKLLNISSKKVNSNRKELLPFSILVDFHFSHFQKEHSWTSRIKMGILLWRWSPTMEMM